MTAATIRLVAARAPCYWRALILAAAGVSLLCLFWFASRYPQLLNKAEHIGQALPSMAYSRTAVSMPSDASVGGRILAASVNWLDSMKIGMTFGILFGALLHTTLRNYPLRISKNLYLNSLRGALVGVPMGVCANCAVPTACGVTRAHGRVEIVLGFLFSSPNFNPVVAMMTFTALPVAMSITKYAVLALVILFLVPSLIHWLERDQPLGSRAVSDASCAIELSTVGHCDERFLPVLKEVALDYCKNVWMLLKPTVAIMLLASVLAAAALTLLPWQSLLAETTPLRLALVSLVSVLMPVPIALDVMFAAQLHQEGVSSSYVMLFAMTLGTYSIIPSIYLWREVSKRLSVLLLCFFVVLGWLLALMF